MNDLLFRRVIEATSRFDALDLLTAVTALQMLPANISRTVRLEVLAYAIATHAVRADRAKASLDDLRTLCNDLRTLCNEEPLASFEIVSREDPPEWHFTEPMAWRRNSFMVFPGISDDSVFSFRHLSTSARYSPGVLCTTCVHQRRHPPD